IMNGTGALGMLDVVFGSLATFLGSLWCWKFREKPKLALLGPVVANALIVPAYLPIILQGLGFYTIPFTSISLEGAYPLMYLFGVLAVGFGQAVVVYVLGLPLAAALRLSYFNELA
ncbi:MAG: QueT transporter family protein, partial [Eggerthellaceae bacterium]|nr:QueT transporter family protein [Eggerthellaceae bacterium]